MRRGGGVMCCVDGVGGLNSKRLVTRTIISTFNHNHLVTCRGSTWYILSTERKLRRWFISHQDCVFMT